MRLPVALRSSGALLAHGEFYGESAPAEGRSYGLRRVLPAVRVRETMIVSVTPSGRELASIWRDLYNAEEHWLDWALDIAGLAQQAQIFGQGLVVREGVRRPALCASAMIGPLRPREAAFTLVSARVDIGSGDVTVWAAASHQARAGLFSPCAPACVTCPGRR